jgi:hypothetical protein
VGEGLARDTSHQDIDATRILGEVELLHIPAMNWSSGMVVAKSVAAGWINLIQQQRRKPSLDEPGSKTSSTSTDLDKRTRH